jgi:hypothetical protein
VAWVILPIAAVAVGLTALVAIVLARSGPDGAELADFVLAAPPAARDAYAYALEHQEVLAHIPCYCGCGNEGHASNLDCFIDDSPPDGKVVYDPMGRA